MKHSWMAACWMAALVAGGCAGRGALVEGPVYPGAAARGPTLDIQVFRRQTEIEFTNTTARAIGASRLWLNRWYSRELSGLGVGETVRLPLREFKDRYGESFRGGGFFATERAEMLALAEIQVEGEVMGMVVVGGEE